MKKIIVIASVLFLSVTQSKSQSVKFHDIAGKWEIVGEKNSGASLNIIDSTTIEVTYMGEKKKISNYTVDFSKSPCWLDFSAADSSATFQVKSLVQKVGDDVLKWQLFIDEDRSPYFTSGKGEIFYLKKVKPATGAIASSD
jgi:hypothetical protein